MSRRLPGAIPRLFFAGFVLPALLPGAGGAQDITVVGIVLEREGSTRIGRATVSITDAPPVFTGEDGAFRITGLAPGPHTLRVDALGYRGEVMTLDLSADTALVVHLDPDPLLLDSLLVRAGTITIKGKVFDAHTGQPVLFAQASIQPGFPPVGAVSGEFTLRRVPMGRAVEVVVEAVEYLPARFALITEADTSLNVALEPDSVGIRIIGQQVQKLEARANAVPFAMTVIDREYLEGFPGWTAYEILEFRLRMVRYSRNPFGMTQGGTTRQCIFIDDVQQVDIAVLWSLWSGEVERVEIYDRGGMVRVYTKRYVVSLLGRTPDPMVYNRTGLMGPVCR